MFHIRMVRSVEVDATMCGIAWHTDKDSISCLSNVCQLLARSTYTPMTSERLDDGFVDDIDNVDESLRSRAYGQRVQGEDVE